MFMVTMVVSSAVASAQVSLAPTSLSFGSVLEGTSSAVQALTVKNSGTSTLTVSSISVDHSTFTLSHPTLPLSLAPAQSFQISVTFKPSGTGSISAWLSIYSNSTYSPNSIALSGTGTAPSAEISVGPTSISFGSQTIGAASGAHALTVTNTGTVNSTVSAITSDNSDFLVSAPTLPVTLAPSKSFQASLTFKPAASGSVSGWISVYSNSLYSPNSVAVSGAGVTSTSSALGVSPSVLSFLNETLNLLSPSQSVKLTNTGTSSLSITALTISPSQFKLVSAPSLPASLSAGESTTLTVAFDPISSSTVAGSLTIASTASSVTVSLSGSASGGSDPSGLNLLTTSLHAGYVQQAYSAILSVSGGVGPYTWSVSSGALPSGLTLDATTGQITGTPTEDGDFSVGIQAVDSTKPSPRDGDKTFTLTVAAGTYDKYGGIMARTCSNGASSHFYTQEINNRWWICTPAGHAFWLRGVYHVDASDTGDDYQGVTMDGKGCSSYSSPSTESPCAIVVEKYGDAGPTWGPQTVRRLQSMGFNMTAEFSSGYVQPTFTSSAWTSTGDLSNPQKMPFTGMIWPLHYARNSNSYAAPIKDLMGPVLSSVYSGTRRASGDVFDPNFAKWLAGDLADYTTAEYNWIHSPHSDYLIGINADDTDEHFGFGPGTDFEALVDGELVTGMAHIHLGWLVWVTAPTQSSGIDADGSSISYSDTTVYSKQAFSSFMSSRYGGNISLLNSAWKSNYTTFGSSGGWGSGTGLLDENGTHSWVPKDPYALTGASSAMVADLNAFLLYDAQQYFSVIKSAINKAAPGVMYLGPTNIGGWGAPPRAQILQAAGQYLNVFAISSIPTGCLSCTDDQARVDFIAKNGGNKPWINWVGFFGQPDSYMSPYSAPIDSFPLTSTQALRGQQFQTMVTEQLNAKDSANSIYHLVGYKWWQYYDDRGEEANWGLTTRRDNGYDGAASVVDGGKDSWGYPTGGEKVNYGDFLGDVIGANFNIYKTLMGMP